MGFAVAVLLVVETAGRWVELVVGLVVVAVGLAGFARFPIVVVVGAVAGVLAPALVLAPTVTNPVRVWPFAACAVVAWLAGRRLPVRPVLAAFGGTVGAGLVAGVLADVVARGGFGLVFGLYDWFLAVLVLLLVAGLPWLAGRYRRQGVEMVAAGVERAALLERTRIAREMHDSLGHEWGLIALRAAALEVSPALDEHTRAQAGELRAGVARATERLHEIVRLLGEPETDLVRLVDHARAAGQDVELTGDAPPGDARVVHRVVREGLTNAAKHAPGLPVTVRVGAEGGHTVVTVENPLPGQPDTGPRDHTPLTENPSPNEQPQRPNTGSQNHTTTENTQPAGQSWRPDTDPQDHTTLTAKNPSHAGPSGRLGSSSQNRTTVTVENPLFAGWLGSVGKPGRGNGSGLDGLREVARVDAGPRNGRFVLTAMVPREPGRVGLASGPRFPFFQRTPTVSAVPRRVWGLVRGPLLAAGVVVVLGGGLFFLAGLDNRLESDVYHTLHIGQRQEDVEKVLPRFQILGDPERTLPAPPPGADCRQYWATVQTDDRLFYRLCFRDGRLVSKETVPR